MTTTIATETVIDMFDQSFLNGGFTVFVKDAPMRRYAVSATHEQSWVVADSPQAFDAFRQLVDRVWNAHPEASAIGGWMADGRIYVDPTETYESRATAEEFGRARNQAAIYDLSTGEDIRL
jgi:hypothetical protein